MYPATFEDSMTPANIMQMPSLSAGARVPGPDEAGELECRQTVESFIDEIAEQSFPASDPPAWGAASSRLERAVWCPPNTEN
jgi:hypothetical protein